MKKMIKAVQTGTAAGLMAAGCLLGGMLAWYGQQRDDAARYRMPEWEFKVDENRTTLVSADLGKTEIPIGDDMQMASKKALPGISGKFQIVLNASGSTEDVGYILNITEHPKNETALQDHIQFQINDGSAEKAYQPGEELKGVISCGVDGGSMKKYITVTWEWIFREGEDIEEILYLCENAEWNVDIAVTSRLY